MNCSARHRFFATIAAAALAALAVSLAGPVPALAAEHSHGAATPHKLALDDGRKWATDEALREGMGRIQGLVAPKLAPAHAGSLVASAVNAYGSHFDHPGFKPIKGIH